MLHLSRHTPHAREKMKRNPDFSVFPIVLNPSLWSTHLDLRSKTRENCWNKYINMFQVNFLRFQMVPIFRWSRAFGPAFPSARRAAILRGLRPVYMPWFVPCRRKSGVGPVHKKLLTDRQAAPNDLLDVFDRLSSICKSRHFSKRYAP